jgi:hypothetical protein
MHLPVYLAFLQRSELALAESYRTISDGHADDPDVHYVTARFADQCAHHAQALAPSLADRDPAAEPERLHVQPLPAHRPGSLGLLRDLQDLHQLAGLVESTWTIVVPAAHGARDASLIRIADECAPQTAQQLAWLRARMRAAAAQTLLVAT